MHETISTGAQICITVRKKIAVINFHALTAIWTMQKKIEIKSHFIQTLEHVQYKMDV